MGLRGIIPCYCQDFGQRVRRIFESDPSLGVYLPNPGRIVGHTEVMRKRRFGSLDPQASTSHSLLVQNNFRIARHPPGSHR